jgi:hypothetical protein
MNGITKILLITFLAGIGVLTTTGFAIIGSAIAQSTMGNATSGGGNATSGGGNATSGGNATDTGGRISDLGRGF